MGVDHRLIRNTENFKGIDKRSSDLARTREYATDIDNAIYRKTGAISKRKGFKVNLNQFDNHFGGFTFRKTNPLNGSTTDEFLAVSTKLQRLVDEDFKISYEGSSDIFVSIFAESSTNFKFQIKDQDVLIMNQNLGTGFSSSDLSLSSLRTLINDVTIPVATIDAVVTPINSTTFDYTIPVENVSKVQSLYVGSLLKILGETTQLEVTSFTEITDPNDEALVVSYRIILEGNSYSLNNVIGSVRLVDYYDLTASYTNTELDGYRAALLTAVKDVKINNLLSGGTNLKAKDWQDIDNGDTSTITTFDWKVNSGDTDRVFSSEDVENATFAQLNNVLYISNGYDYLMKYDGQRVYRAGLPALDNDTATAYFTCTPQSSSNPIHTEGDDKTFEYRFVLEYTDAIGNIISSQPSKPIIKRVPTGNNVAITWTSTVLETFLEGRDLTGVFDEPHPLYENLEELVSQARPTATSLADNLKKYQEEKRLRVKIYRSLGYNLGSIDDEPVGQYYQIADLPYDEESFTDRSVDPHDTIVTNFDINTLLAYAEPVKRQDPPPKGRYITGFKNCLVSAGNITNVNNVQYSLPKNTATGEIGSEYFPEDDNAIVVDSLFGDRVNAIAPLRDLLYIFHKNSIHVLGGNINLLELPVVDLLTKEGGVGCLSQGSIQEFRNQLIFLSEEGVYTIDSSNAISELSAPIKPFFDDLDLKVKRSVSYNWVRENLMIINIPKEKTSVTLNTIDTISISQNSTQTDTNTLLTRANKTFKIFDTDYLPSANGTGASFEITTDANGDILLENISVEFPGEAFTANETIYIDDDFLGGFAGAAITLNVDSVVNRDSSVYTSGEEESLIIVYDYFKNAWLKWTNVDITGGVALYDEKVTFLSRTRNGSYLKIMSESDTTYDYADHADAIDFRYETNWESLNEPTIPKKFLRLKLYSFDTDGSFESPGFSVNVFVQKNYVPFDLGSFIMDFGQTLGWGEEPWGEFKWGSNALNFLKSKLAPGKTKSLKLSFQNNTLNENVLITNYEMEIAAPYGMEIKD
jgi:hypothetical protein